MSIYTATSPRGTQETLGTIELPLPESREKIMHDARIAFYAWSKISITKRIQYITLFLELYKEKKELIAQSISKEIGKPITQARADIDYDIGYITYYLNENILNPELVYKDISGVHTIYYEPTGVCVSIAPRNYPTSQLIWEVIPPLLSGNTVIFKPASACFWTSKLVCDLIISCLPKNAFIPFYGTGESVNKIISGDVDIIIFTGSSSIGKKIAEAAAPGLKKTFLELGGSAPGIILPDAHIDDAMMETISWFRRRHGGQICDGLKRLFVHRSKYDELIALFTSYLADKKIGNPLDPDTDLGCLVNQSRHDSIQTQLEDATEKGAQLLELGVYDGTPGPFMKHTLVLHPTLDMRIMQEETFGPVLPIMIYETTDEVISRANSTPYGLGGYVRGNTPQEVEMVCRCLKTGNINVNNTNYVIPQVPFGGYKKASGNCREHGVIGLREYCQVKVVSCPF